MRKPLFDIYHASPDERCRYALGKNGRRMIAVIGLNPSTANQHFGDATATRVENVIRMNGFDGFVLLNLAPVRATHPKDLPVRLPPELFERNLAVLRQYLSQTQRIWAAWGQGIELRAYLEDTLRELGPVPEGWRCYGPRCRGGHPRHPGRLAYRWRFGDFMLGPYLENCSLKTKEQQARRRYTVVENR